MQQEWTGERLETFVYNETMIEHLHRYAIAMEYVKDKDVLDIASGEGYGANLLAGKARNVMGVDIDGPTIKAAQKKYTKTNLEFKQGQVEKIPAPDHAFDVVVSFETLEHTREHEKMLTEIKRVLKPGGILIISTPDKKNYSDLPGYNNPFHLKELYEHEFKALLSKFFANHHCFYQALTLTSVAFTESEKKLKVYDGDYEKIQSRNNIDAGYLLAIASDLHIDRPDASIFMSHSVLQTILDEKERLVKNTLSYKIGHFLLWPLKLIRNTRHKKS